MSTKQRTEVLFLNIFKIVVLAIMALALLVTVGTLILAASEYAKKPVEPAPAKVAPTENVNLEDFLKQLQPPKADKAPAKDEPTERQQDSPNQPKPAEQKYLNDAKKLNDCYKDFESKVRQNVVIEEENFRRWIQGTADNRKYDRGQPWVTDMVKFNCPVFANQAVIELVKGKPDLKILSESIEYHLERWDEIKENIKEFNRNEQRRIEEERNAEEARILAAKAQAFILLIVAGSAFAVFMVLALYLIFSAIESNLRRIGETLHDLNKKQFNQPMGTESSATL